MNKFDWQDVFCIVNASEAEKYKGDFGYFGNTKSELEEAVSKSAGYILDNVTYDGTYNFYAKTTNCMVVNFGLFIPESKVISDRGIRAFNDVAEFIKVVCNGNPDNWIIMRRIGNTNTKNNIWHYRLQAYSDDLNQVIFGYQLNFSLECLRDRFVWLDNEGNWQRFGIEI